MNLLVINISVPTATTYFHWLKEIFRCIIIVSPWVLLCILYYVSSVLCVVCTMCLLYYVSSVLRVFCTTCLLYYVYSVLRVFCTTCLLYYVSSVLRVFCTTCRLYYVSSVLCVFCTTCLLYYVSTTNSSIVYEIFSLFIIGTTLYICMSALPFE